MDTVEAFLARGGKIEKVEAGTRAIASDRRIYAAMRSGERISSDANEAERDRISCAENAAERRMETFMGARFAGASVSEALDAANHAASRRSRRR